MSKSPPISFIVIAYNEESNIESTLDAITSLHGLCDYEVIVVNDGSVDATASIVKGSAARDPHIRLIDLVTNTGRGHARSVGVKAAQGELIATVDADILLPRDWLIRTTAALTQCDAVAGIPVPDGDVAYIHRRFQLTPRVVLATATVTGSNGLYRRRVFDLVQYDSSLREGEDSALNHDMRRCGFSLATLPDLLVVHQEKKSFITSLKWLFAVGRGATRQLFEYHQIRQPDVFTGTVLAGLIVGVFIAIEVSWLGILLPLALVWAAAIQHVTSRFYTSMQQPVRVALAVTADGAMLMAYFCGRLAGIVLAIQRRKSARAIGGA